MTCLSYKTTIFTHLNKNLTNINRPHTHVKNKSMIVNSIFTGQHNTKYRIFFRSCITLTVTKQEHTLILPVGFLFRCPSKNRRPQVMATTINYKVFI